MSKNKEPRMNLKIHATDIRLVDVNGDMLGIVNLNDALIKAKSNKLDLVEISPNAKPPVCKIMDYGKFKYQQQKRLNDSRKKQKTISVKEIKLRPNIDSHDLETKMRNVYKFLEAGDKVKFSMRFRGREITHKEIGQKLLNSIKEELRETVKIEMQPKFEGRQMLMIVAPIVK